MADRPSYRQYELKKLGHRSDQVRGIVYMVSRSFRAPSFGAFWQRWNPLFSYYLMYYCYQPLRQHFPPSVCVLLTFTASGAVHDAAASLLLFQPMLLFTVVFLLYGIFTLLEKSLGFHLRAVPASARPFYHLVLLAGGYFAARVMAILPNG